MRVIGDTNRDEFSKLDFSQVFAKQRFPTRVSECSVVVIKLPFVLSDETLRNEYRRRFIVVTLVIWMVPAECRQNFVASFLRLLCSYEFVAQSRQCVMKRNLRFFHAIPFRLRRDLENFPSHEPYSELVTAAMLKG